MAGPFRAAVPRVDRAGARRRPAAALQAPRLMDDPERRALVVGPTRDDHWSPDQISGRITMERPDLAVSGESIYRAVHSGSSDCELPRHRKASMPLGQPDGLLRAQGQSAPGRRGTTRRAGRPRLLLPSPPPLGARDQREHERAPQGLAPERREPRRCHRRSPKGRTIRSTGNRRKHLEWKCPW